MTAATREPLVYQRWHDPAEDCPKRAAFLDALLRRQPAPPPTPKPEPRRCKLKACDKPLGCDRRDDTDFCCKLCRNRYRYAKSGATATARSTMKHAGQCRKCGTPRPAGERCPTCQAATKQRSNAKYRAKQHPAILPSEAVGA